MTAFFSANRYHDFSCGHRVVGHEGKCALLHGHNYRVHFYVSANELDEVGRVIDFSVINTRLCQWLERDWDHRFLAWKEDAFMRALDDGIRLRGTPIGVDPFGWEKSIVWVPFNPTAENIAEYLVNVVGPKQLQGTGCKLIGVKVDETRKCSAVYKKEA